MHKGSCLCGAVRFEVTCALPPPNACHCSMCRRQSGHFWVSVEVPKSALTFTGADKITWFSSSQKVRRGFCSLCGSFLFWCPLRKNEIAVAMGAFDPPTGTKLAKHIYVAEKGDYYELDDGLPQNQH